MNTIADLDQKLDAIRSLGYTVRYDWFGGAGGGACRIGDRKYLFLDLALGAIDHLSVANQLLDRELPADQTDSTRTEPSRCISDNRAA